jgi:small subunit ribosomal protein S20
LANSAQARKRSRQAENHRQHNMGLRSMLRTHIKKVIKAIAQGNVEQAQAQYQVAIPIIDRMANKGLIHKNKAARHKSRLNTRIHAMQSS